MPTYNVFPVEISVYPSHLTSYIALRLTSLQIDPQAFASNYAREVAFSEDVWRKRLDSRSQRTFVASVLKPCASERGDIDDMGARETEEWVGTAGIVGSSDLPPSILAPFKEAGVGDNWEIYVLFAMWVHPAHRGRGVGAQLVKACMEWARTNKSDVRDFEKVVVLLVFDDNVAGRTLYSRIGFADLENVQAKDGERWMFARV